MFDVGEPGVTKGPGIEEPLRVYSGEWSLVEFIEKLSAIRNSLPTGTEARVQLDTLPYDHAPSLSVRYASEASEAATAAR